MNQTFDFAFSFAGEDRAIVEEIKTGLSEYKIFYDNDYQAELCGKDLYNFLRNLYMNRAKYVVCFLSEHYKKKVWTNVEFSAVKERLMATFFASDFLIPIILDKSIMFEDIPSYIGFYQHESTPETIKRLKEKYQQSLNEDIYLENINHFSSYLLLEVARGTKEIEFSASENMIITLGEFHKKKFYLLSEKFSKLPCLLLYEAPDLHTPVAMISWKRSNNILFHWECFSDCFQAENINISLNELILILRKYILNRK